MASGRWGWSDGYRYTLVHSTNTLRRVLKEVDSENQFILKQTVQNGNIEKSNIPFLDFSDLESFNTSKMGILNKVLSNLNSKLSDYLKIDFIYYPVDKTIRYSNTFKIQNIDQSIYLIDGIQDEDSFERINELKAEILQISPLSKLKTVKKAKRDGLNIGLIHNKNYYKKYELKDPYQPNLGIQHITLEDFKIDSKASIKAVIKESIIKKDIENEKISIVDWKHYEFNNKWIFGYKQGENFFYLTIHPDGTLKFEDFEPNLFNQNEYDDLCNIFNEESNIEFLVKDDIGNINSIKRTGDYTIPEFEIIHKVLKDEAKEINVTLSEVKTIINDNSERFKNPLEIITCLESVDTWGKKTLLNCFNNRNDKKTFVEIVQKEKNELLKSYFRDKTRYRILDSQLDIHSFNYDGRYFYYVGLKGAGIQQQISRACIIREIKPYKNSKLIFKDLLPLMNIDFVKNGDLTVLPFPLKYLGLA